MVNSGWCDFFEMTFKNKISLKFFFSLFYKLHDRFQEYWYQLSPGREYLADILDRHVSCKAHAKYFRTST